MRFLQSISELEAQHRPSVVTIGNFDGVHLGHKKIIDLLISKAKKENVPSMVITFEPLAREYFQPQDTSRILPLRQRVDTILSYGIDFVLCLPFDDAFRQMSAEDYVTNILVAKLGVRYVCVGDDFRFGHQRKGDFEFLRLFGEKHNFKVEAHPTFEIGNGRVSSGRLRKLLEQGDFGQAETLLGRPYTIVGRVCEGKKLGRTIGFPTANIILDNQNSKAAKKLCS